MTVIPNPAYLAAIPQRTRHGMQLSVAGPAMKGAAVNTIAAADLGLPADTRLAAENHIVAVAGTRRRAAEVAENHMVAVADTRLAATTIMAADPR